MSEGERLSHALTRLFEDNRNGWLCPFTEAVKGLNAVQATWVPGEGLNSIWALVNHIRIETEVVAARLQGLSVDYAGLGDKDGWPPVGKAGDDSEWQQACQRALPAHKIAAGLVASLTDEQLAQPVGRNGPSTWYTVQCLIAHTHYHTGQIVFIRRLQGSWSSLQWMPPSS